MQEASMASSRSTGRRVLRGALAGAAGTTALNAVTYLDMTLRGRASSSTPQETVDALAHRAGLEVPGDDETRQNRLRGLGALSGIATGITAGVIVALARPRSSLPNSLVALVAALTAGLLGNAPMATLDISHPTEWSLADWLSDVLPHAAYGAIVATVLGELAPRG
jgi:hypothetical protein